MIKRKIALILVTTFFILFSSHTFAEEGTTTGTDSQNQQSITTESTSELTTTNEALTQNAISLGADTGSNNIENGTIIDNFTSGDISGQITAANTANSNLAQGSSLSIKTADQDNQVNVDDFNNMDNTFVIGTGSYPSDPDNQLLYVNNNEQINLDLNTGENNFEHNTLINSATTGDIDFATNMVNINNLNNPSLMATLKVYSILGDFVGDVVIEDSFLNEEPAVEIYDDSQNTLTNNITSETTDSQFNMNTGENELASNSLVGSTSSGDVAAGYFQNEFAGLLNKANFFILNVLGEWTGNNFLSGYDNVIINTLDTPVAPAEVTAYENSDQNSTNIINQDTTFNVNANTGRNRFNQNTYIGKLDTGHINLLEYVLALKPDLRSLKNKLNIRVLNILGKWKGNLTKTAKATEPLPPDVPTTQPDTPVLPDNNNTNGQFEDRGAGQVLGVQDVAISDQPADNIVLASSINPGEIEAGPNINYLLYLLLITCFDSRKDDQKVLDGLDKK